MSLRDTARYAYGLDFTRLMPLNDDLTIPIPSRIIGGAGPFDFSFFPETALAPFLKNLNILAGFIMSLSYHHY